MLTLTDALLVIIEFRTASCTTVRRRSPSIDRFRQSRRCIRPAIWGNAKVKQLFRNPIALEMSLHTRSTTQIVNYVPIIFPAAKAMSEGDVIRLNRMYHCGPAYNSGNNPPDPLNATSNEIENQPRMEKPKQKSSIFGMFIFKIIPEN